MFIRVYQINHSRDSRRLCYLPLDASCKHGDYFLDSSIYDQVYEGSVDCENLEDIYRRFNIQVPDGYHGRSLSVSDVVEVTEELEGEKGFYYCDSLGFVSVNFDPSLCERPDLSRTLRVLLVEPDKYPKMIEIGDSLEDMQRIVQGPIEEILIEDEVVLILNEEGKIRGLPLNRALRNDYGEVTDVIAGTFFIGYAPWDSDRLMGLPEIKAEKYAMIFRYPEHFYYRNRQLCACPYRPENRRRER